LTQKSVALLGALAALLAVAGSAQDKQTILFVCEHGAAKSVIAAAHFNQMAESAGLPYRAVSRGTNPDQEIPSKIKQGLAADDLDVSSWKPRAVTEDDIRKARRVVTLGCTLPVKKSLTEGKLSEWNNVPPVSESYEAARKAIVDQVAALVKSLPGK